MKKSLFPLILILLPLLTIALSLFAGRYSMDAVQTVHALFFPDTVSPEQLRVVWYLRLPRAVASAMCGAALAVSGAAFQGVFRNPLVNSGLLGVSNGAGFGACLAIVFFGGGAFTYGFAFVFAVLAVILSYYAGRISKVTTSVTLILQRT